MENNKKKMSVYIKYPLVLGLVCLVTGGALGAINYITAPIIAKQADAKSAEAVNAIIGADNVESTTTLTRGDSAKYVLDVVQVKRSNGADAYYYKVVSDRGYSGTITFGIAFSEEGILGYYFIEGDEDVKGLNLARDNKLFSDALKNYDAGSGGSIVLDTSSTLPATLPAMQKAIDEAYADYMGRLGIVVDTSLVKLRGYRNRRFGFGNSLRDEYRVFTTTTSPYGVMYLSIEIYVATGNVSKVTVNSSGMTDTYGLSLIADGTVTDPSTGDSLATPQAINFYNTFCKIPTGGIPAEVFIGEGAPDPQADNFDGANAVFNTGASFSARSYFAAIQRAIQASQNDEEQFGSFNDVTNDGYLLNTLADGSKVYRVKTENSVSGYGSLVSDITLDPASNKVMKVDIYDYVNTTFGFGFLLLNGSNGGRLDSTGAETFIETYIKIPEGGLDFSLFYGDDALDYNSPKATDFENIGATYTAKAYYASVAKAIEMCVTGDDGEEFTDMPKSCYIINVEKVSDGVYHGTVRNTLDTANYSIADATVTLDLANSKVTAIDLDTDKIGTGGYGDTLFTEGTSANSIFGADQGFYDMFIKMPEGGFDFDLFKEYIPYDLPPEGTYDLPDMINSTGATLSVNNYMVLINWIIQTAEGEN